MMRVDVPPKEPDAIYDGTPPMMVKVHADLSLAVEDDRGEHELALKDLAAAVAAQHTKAVFVDFDPGVPWSLAVSTLDSIRSVARDANHDEIRVLLRTHDD
jgi:biopolymer transport protein ExbD